MQTDVLKIVSAAFYGSVAQEFDNLTFDEDIKEALRFLVTMSAKIHYVGASSLTVEPVNALPAPGSTVTLRGYSKATALLLLGAAANLGCTFRFIDMKDCIPTRDEANKMTDFVHGVMQIGIAPNGFVAASANYGETNGCIACEPAEFAAGVLLALPLSGVNSCFAMREFEGNELLETAYERLLRYGLVTKRVRDVVYTKSVRREKITPKKKKAGRPKKHPAETEKA